MDNPQSTIRNLKSKISIPDPAHLVGERWLIFFLLCAILATLTSGWLFYQRWPQPTSIVIHPPPTALPPGPLILTLTPISSDALVMIMINGSVLNPGSYVLHASATISDALRAAGGTTADATLRGIDLEQVLVDGMLITVR